MACMFCMGVWCGWAFLGQAWVVQQNKPACAQHVLHMFKGPGLPLCDKQGLFVHVDKYSTVKNFVQLLYVVFQCRQRHTEIASHVMWWICSSCVAAFAQDVDLFHKNEELSSSLWYSREKLGALVTPAPQVFLRHKMNALLTSVAVACLSVCS